MNPYKWLLISFDCSALWLKNRDYIVDAFNVNPVYLQHIHQGHMPDFRDWQISLASPFRSLKMWFVFRSYGIKGLQNHIRKQVGLAKYFQSLLLKDDRFELSAPVEMNLVCFRLKGTDALNEKFVKLINDGKAIHLTPTRVGGQFIIRFMVSARTIEVRDIDFAWNEFQRQALIALTL